LYPHIRKHERVAN